jgi:carbonic anhydrase/acetyltransferase-like protein (isoleucine patch superfamily)
VKPRRVVRVASGRVVAPWGDPVSRVRILGMPLEERQDRVLAGMGLRWNAEMSADEAAATPAAAGELRWRDDVDVTPAALRAFLKAAGVEGGRMCTLERPARAGELEVEPSGSSFRFEGADQATRRVAVTLGPSERDVTVPPRGFGGTMRTTGPFRSETAWWITDRTATTIAHWSHVLRANLSALPAAFGENLVRQPWRVLWTWARSPLQAGGGRLAVVGKRCRIHPTARLEMCILGDDVEVGAYSVLRGCVLGDGARVEDHVTARGAVVGPGAHLGNYCLFNISVLGARSSISHIGAQATVVGDETFIATFASLLDLNLTGNIRVPWEGRLADTGTPFLGCAVGHRVRMGAGTWVAQGRAIPNDITLVAQPHGMLARIPTDVAPGVYAVEDGRLVPVSAPRTGP